MLLPDRFDPLHANQLRSPRPRQQWRVLLTVIGVLLIIAAALTLWFNHHPESIAARVDDARALFGPQPVAEIETWVFGIQDQLRHAQYQATGVAPGLHWATVPPQTQATLHPAAKGSSVNQSAPTIRAQPATPATLSAAVGTTSAPSSSAPTQTNTQLNWSPYVAAEDGTPILERTIVAPDPERPYVQAALVRIDLTHAQLHLVAGTTEPLSTVAAARPGNIPHTLLNANILLAAFNGGFKAANGHYGMAIDGKTLLPPQDGLATLAIYRDGTLRLGVWGQDMQASPDMIAFRQNCPLLLDNGLLTPEAETPTTALWGKTVGNKVTTWRSGLGLSADGKTLIYAVGDGLTVPSLAAALRQGGAARAMQLDINSLWTRFVTFAPTAAGALQAQKLLDNMQGGPHQFITPDTRDFFYLTRRPVRS